jgi:hypothetical protein
MNGNVMALRRTRSALRMYTAQARTGQLEDSEDDGLLDDNDGC